MKKLLFVLGLVLWAGYAFSQEYISVNVVNCPPSGCVSCAACNCSGFATTGTNCDKTASACMNPTQCGGIECFSDVDITALPFTPASCDYIEVGLSLKKRIKIFAVDGVGANAGDSVKICSDLDPAAAQMFTMTNLTTPATGQGGKCSSDPGLRIAYNSGDEIEITFKPTSAVTILSLDLIVTSSTCTNTISMSAHAIDPTPKNYVLAMDRSGSMGSTVTTAMGTSTKSNRLVEASQLFLDLLQAKSVSNKFGLIAYDNTTNAYKTTLDDATMANVGTAKMNFLTNAAGKPLAPGASTGIGNAISESMKLLLGSYGECPFGMLDPADAKDKIVVLMTDGIENQPNFVDCALGPCLTDACLKQAYIYTIGFGDDGDFNEPLLQNLPGRSAFSCLERGSQGYYRVNTSTGDTDLSAAYAKIFMNSNNLDVLVDPVAMVNVFDGVQKTVHRAQLTTSDRYGLFVVLEESSMKNLYTLDLVSPKGDAAKNGTFGTGLKGEIIDGIAYKIYKIDFAAANAAEYSGTWNLVVTPKAKKVDGKVDSARFVPIGFVASTFSDLKMNTQMVSAGTLPGSEIIVGIDAVESGLPVKIKQVTATITHPSGKRVPVKVDVDSFGKHIIRYADTFESGTYSVLVRSIIINSKGETAVREDSRSVVLAHPSDYVAHPPKCNTCVLWIVIGVAVLIIIILVIAYQRKK